MTDKDALKIASWLVADELCGERTEYCGKSCIECCYAVQERLRQMANKQTETERPHGEWIPQDEFEAYHKCSNCGILIDNDFPVWRNFCPNCGADMRGKKNG